VTSLRTRQRFLAATLGLGLATASPAALAAENIVFISGAFRRSIPVADLEHLAATGQARGLLGDVMRFGRQDPQEVARLLKASLNLPVVTVSRLLNTSIGERILGPLVHGENGVGHALHPRASQPQRSIRSPRASPRRRA
jgi:hypothetical protein